ncbi:FadR/GntR family transcriptional regulator [Cognatishimia sp. SS12]|uniref:FadR/GntR family transcriptional regulator n=1 Tax=Cognatishimia sp. SS12 TaxID=2979465 RepID=UPI00232B9444|nr:FadR/GntR family transcriptional regulator [Cognatishimia sp. SS12]MDC0739599.1 FadR/GntR family transcriptional regulator [Cognatishimia sp. SS12]
MKFIMDAKGVIPVNQTLSRSLSGQVSRTIGERILEGVLQPGQLLPDEVKLCEEFGVSRTVIREAVKMLVAKGMLEVRQRIGTRVQDIRNWQMLDRDILLWHQGIPVDNDRIMRLLELRQSIEPDAARYAAERRTEADLENIFNALDRMAKNLDESNEYVIADAQFHIAILRAAHNPYLDSLENAIFAGLMLSIRLTNPDRDYNKRSLPFHQNIAEVIRKQDTEGAYMRMKEHLADSNRRLLEQMS